MYYLRKIGFYILVISSLVLATWAYFHLKENKAPNVSVLERIPSNVACIIETKNCSELVSQLTRQNLIWNSLLNNESINVAQNGIKYLDSLINEHVEISKMITDNSVYWTFIQQKNSFEHLILFKLKEKNNESILQEFFNQSFFKDNSISSFSAFYFLNNKQKWIVACIDGIVYVSSDLGVLQNCLELKKSESLAQNKNYLDLLALNSENPNLIYFNHSLANLISRNLFTQQSLFSAEIKLNEITLTGYSNTDSASFFSVFKNQHESLIDGFSNMPDNPFMLEGISVSECNKFYSNVGKQLSTETISHNKKAWEALNDSALYNIREETYNNINGAIISASYYLNDNISQIFEVNMNDDVKFSQLLSFMSDSIYNTLDLKIVKLKDDFSKLFSLKKTDLAAKYACLLENNLMLFSDQSALDLFLKTKETNQFLYKNEQFMNYANDHLLLECNYFYYENSELIKLYNLNSIINSETLWRSENATSKISITAKNFNNKIQVRINASHAQPQVDNNSINNVLWTFNSDSIINTSAYVFKNHLTNENELCFQDNTKQLYLINSTGNLVWKKKINEAVLSDFYTVDLFKNGKYQLLFNTENYLHLIDRNGNYVQGYPVKLPAKVTSNITLFDYENNKDYRVFLACADKRIYNFTLYGLKTEGFVPVKTEAVVTLPIKHVSVGLSDYLITADVAGKLYVFSRKGEGRIDFKNKTIENLNHLYVSAGNNLNTTKLNYIDDKNNLLNKITLSDTKEALKLGDELKDFNVSFELVNDDSQSDFIMYGNGAVYAYDLFSSKLIEYFNDLSIYTDVQLIQLGDRSLLIAYDKTGEKLDVINMGSKLEKIIPGATQKPLICDLYKNGKTYLLLVNSNKVSCQELK
jgi:hypothetical protein